MSEPHLQVADQVTVPCVRERYRNVYVYHPEELWIGYAIVVAVTFVSLIVGGLAIVQNGVSSDTLFSRIMVTTRNPTIDRLSVGACLGGDPFPADLRRTKLRFGVLLEADPSGAEFDKVEHCAFGTEGETKKIVNYGKYAGLKAYRQRNDDDAAGEKASLPRGEDRALDRISDDDAIEDAS